MKKLVIWIASALLLASFAGCGRDGIIRDTTSNRESEPASESDRASLPESGVKAPSESARETAGESGTGAATEGTSGRESESDSETGRESESETDMLSGILGSFFDMTRDMILEKRGESGEVPKDRETSLSYGDRYAGFEGRSLYDFDENGRLSGISLSFGKDHTLEEIAEAVTRMNPEAVTQNGSTTWTSGDIVYTLSEGEDGPVLSIRKGI